MIYIVATICAICCLVSGGITVYVIHQSAKERQMLVSLLAAKDYADYKAFDSEPDNNSEHNNMFISRRKAKERREEFNRE